jgi:hypothetical protein
MKKIYIVEDLGLNVREYELLREDDLFVYCRYVGEKGRGFSRPKFFAHHDRAEAYDRAAKMLEDKAREHREAIPGNIGNQG